MKNSGGEPLEFKQNRPVLLRTLANAEHHEKQL